MNKVWEFWLFLPQLEDFYFDLNFRTKYRLTSKVDLCIFHFHLTSQNCLYCDWRQSWPLLVSKQFWPHSFVSSQFRPQFWPHPFDITVDLHLFKFQVDLIYLLHINFDLNFDLNLDFNLTSILTSISSSIWTSNLTSILSSIWTSNLASTYSQVVFLSPKLSNRTSALVRFLLARNHDS